MTDIRDRSPLRRDNIREDRMAVPQLQKHHIDCIPDYDENPATSAIFIQSSQYLINNFSDNTNIANPQNEFLLRAIIGKLTGRALNLVGSRGNLRNWLSIKNLLLQFFSDQRDENCLVGDLMHLRQGKLESPVHFGHRCQDLLSLLLNKIQLTENNANILELKKNLFEKQALNAFLRGLHSNLPIRLRNPQTLEQAIAFTIEEQNFAYARRNLTYINSMKPTSPQFRSLQNRRNIHRPLYQNLSSVNQTPPTQIRQNTINSNSNNQRSIQMRNYNQTRSHQHVPMDTSSSNTRRTDRPQNQILPNRPLNQRNFISEELFQQEIDVGIDQYDENDYFYDDYYTNSDYDPNDQYEVTEFSNDNQYSDSPEENFHVPVSHQNQT